MSKPPARLTLPALAAMLVLPFAAPAQEIKRGAENLVHRSPVEYPGEAIENKIEGTVVIEARLDGKGVVRDARVISGPDELRGAVLKSVLDWHYSEKGAPPIVEIAIEFKLPKNRTGSSSASGAPGTLKSIEFNGVPNELKEKVLKEIAMKEGDSISKESYPRIFQAVRRADEHLRVEFSEAQSNVRIVLSMPSALPKPASPGGVIGGVLGGIPSSAPPPPAAPGTIRVGGNVQEHNLIKRVDPVYPPLAIKAKIQGVVRFNVIIAKDGTIRNMQLMSGHPLLVPAAQEAVRQWAYRPTLLNGNPVEVQTSVDVNFSLPAQTQQ